MMLRIKVKMHGSLLRLQYVYALLSFFGKCEESKNVTVIG